MKSLVISDKIEEKLKDKHNVSRREVEQCFDNKDGVNLADTRGKHKTYPPTWWFIAETNHGRLLKIVHVFKDGKYYLKTAYEPNQEEIDIYSEYGKKEAP